MVTFTVEVPHSKDLSKLYKEGTCLSSDAKPVTGLVNGSKLLEMDTSTLYMFDEANSTWRAW